MGKQRKLSAQATRKLIVENYTLLRGIKAKRFIGLDPSQDGFGYCVIDATGEIIEKGSVGHKTSTHGQKVRKIVLELKDVIDRHKPEVAAFEMVNVSGRKSFNAVVALGRAHGAMYASLGDEVEALIPINVQTVKRAGRKPDEKDKSTKADLRAFILDHYGYDLENDDEADAYLVARIGARAWANANNFDGTTDKDVMDYLKLKFKNSCDRVEFEVANDVLKNFNMLAATNMKLRDSVKRRVFK